MSKIDVRLENDVLVIHKVSSRKKESDTERYKLDILQIGKEYKSNLRVTKMEDKNKILFIKKVDAQIEDNKVEIEDDDLEQNKSRLQPVIVVFSRGNIIRFIYCSLETAYKKFLKLRYKVLKLSLNKRAVKIKLLAYIINKYNLEYGEQKFYIDKQLGKTIKLKQYPLKISKLKMLKDWNIYNFKFNMEDILKDTSEINGQIRITLNIDGTEIAYNIAIKDKKIKRKQHYYGPIRKTYTDKYAIHIRRTNRGSLVLVERPTEPIENTLKFKILESTIVSATFKFMGKVLSKFRKRKINLFYEKFSSKAEEGTYDLFLLFQKYKNTQNYFIIDEHSQDYEKIKNTPGVVKKYSLKYYWLIYNAINCISTEAPIHLNIIRSNNAILRKTLMDKKFVFLQHGVTYLKCQGKNSTFRIGKEGEVSFIVAGSEKEKDAIVEMLRIDEEQVLKTGLPIFSKIDYKHINQNSDDFVTIMLTWKPYEEHLYNFEESMTYKNTIEVCNMLKKYIDPSKIIIISHPKAYSLLKNTDLKKSLWNKPISKALEKTKLLITDYSSVCYNSFYQGSGVIFFQPDLEKFEIDNGELIPSSDEYIGERVYNIEQLENVIKKTIKDGKIDLNVVRTPEYEERYKSINEFSDGKNIERIYDKLLEMEII